MRLYQAAFASVMIHAALMAWLFHSPATDYSSRASSPLSSLRATLLPYQAPTVASELAPPQSAGDVALKPVDPSTAESSIKSSPVIQSDNSAKAIAVAKPDVVATTTAKPTIAKSTGTSGDAVFESSALDASPALQTDINIEYPASANNREGTVSLAIIVAADGRVESVAVLQATPVGFFEAAAIKGFQDARFSAGTIAGIGVKSRLVVEVEFTPTNRGGSVSGQRN